jgi:hypothetical protein
MCMRMYKKCNVNIGTYKILALDSLKSENKLKIQIIKLLLLLLLLLICAVVFYEIIFLIIHRSDCNM